MRSRNEGLRAPALASGGSNCHLLHHEGHVHVRDGWNRIGAGASARGGGPRRDRRGAATVNQYLAAGLVDELRLHVAPLLLGAGERLFDGVGNVSLEPLQVRHTGLVTHLSYGIHARERSS